MEKVSLTLNTGSEVLLRIQPRCPTEGLRVGLFGRGGRRIRTKEWTATAPSRENLRGDEPVKSKDQNWTTWRSKIWGRVGIVVVGLPDYADEDQRRNDSTVRQPLLRCNWPAAGGYYGSFGWLKPTTLHRFISLRAVFSFRLFRSSSLTLNPELG